MSARRMDPYAELISTRSLIARRCAESRDIPPIELPKRTFPTTVPIDILENPEQFTVVAELPGVDPQSLEVTVANNVLSIRGQVPAPAGPPPRTYSHKPNCCGPVARTVPLPKPVDGDKATAAFHNGVLSVIVPKSPAGAPTRIHIKPPNT